MDGSFYRAHTAKVEWGHLLLGPAGEEIRVPAWVFPQLRRLRLLEKNPRSGQIQLKRIVYEFLDPKYDTLTEGLRRLLGSDLSGPAWLICRCRECQQERSEGDRTRMPWRMIRR